MKILHTADWHLGKRLSNFSRHEEQVAVLNEICEIAEEQKVDIVLIAGDVFDAFNPPSESTQLFYKTVKRLSDEGRRPVIVIAGNHDSPDRIISADPLAQECGILLIGHPFQFIQTGSLGQHEISKSDHGFVEITLKEYSRPLRIITTPYASEFRLKKFLGIDDSEEELRRILSDRWSNLAKRYCNAKGVNILMSHLFFSDPTKPAYAEPDAEKPILHVGGAQMIYPENVPAEMHYVALGHLHKYHFVSHDPTPIAYSGSPLAYSFSETEQEKYILLLESEENLELKVSTVNLSRGLTLIQKLFDSVDEAIAWLEINPDFLVDLTVKASHGISTADRNRIFKAHQHIISLIPERDSDDDEEKEIVLSPFGKMEDLFSEFYKNSKGHPPAEEVMALFKEVNAQS